MLSVGLCIVGHGSRRQYTRIEERHDPGHLNEVKIEELIRERESG